MTIASIRSEDYRFSVPDSITRPHISNARRVVIKVGTRVLSLPEGGIAKARLERLMHVIADLRQQSKEVLLVTSGAVGLGAHVLALEVPVRQISDRQACAAVGQSRLMAIYEEGLRALGVQVGQVLLTHGDFDDRNRYLNVRNTLLSLLRHGILPIINENDAVSIAELQDLGNAEPVFGDNDRLSALVASKLGADLLILLTDVPGLYDRDPSQFDDAVRISTVPFDESTPFEAGATGSNLGRGGMRSKVDAARIAARAGCHAIIASGLDTNALQQVLDGEDCGSWFPAQQGLNARRRWIAWGSPAKGVLHLDTGAVRALRDRGASLLAAGVQRIEGDFVRGDVVELRAENNALIGRGMISCDANAAALWSDGQAPAAARNHHALVHRDHLVLEPNP